MKNIEFSEIGSMIILWPFFGLFLCFFALFLLQEKYYTKINSNKMTLSEKFKKVFESGHSISFQNVVKRSDGEWHSRIVWRDYQLPSNQIIEECEWFGFEEIEECVDDCLKYLNTIKK